MWLFPPLLIVVHHVLRCAIRHPRYANIGTRICCGWSSKRCAFNFCRSFWGMIRVIHRKFGVFLCISLVELDCWYVRWIIIGLTVLKCINFDVDVTYFTGLKLIEGGVLSKEDSFLIEYDKGKVRCCRICTKNFWYLYAHVYLHLYIYLDFL